MAGPQPARTPLPPSPTGVADQPRSSQGDADLDPPFRRRQVGPDPASWLDMVAALKKAKVRHRFCSLPRSKGTLTITEDVIREARQFMNEKSRGFLKLPETENDTPHHKPQRWWGCRTGRSPRTLRFLSRGLRGCTFITSTTRTSPSSTPLRPPARRATPGRFRSRLACRKSTCPYSPCRSRRRPPS